MQGLVQGHVPLMAHALHKRLQTDRPCQGCQDDSPVGLKEYTDTRTWIQGSPLYTAWHPRGAKEAATCKGTCVARPGGTGKKGKTELGGMLAAGMGVTPHNHMFPVKDLLAAPGGDGSRRTGAAVQWRLEARAHVMIRGDCMWRAGAPAGARLCSQHGRLAKALGGPPTVHLHWGV